MPWLCAALSAAGVLEPIICSCLVVEFAGYWLHRLLRTDKLPTVTRNHMAHHLLLYAPMQPMRGEGHKDATEIHRHGLDHGRRRNANFGIGFFLSDRIFRTLAKRHYALHSEGLAIALPRYRLAKPFCISSGKCAEEGTTTFQ